MRDTMLKIRWRLVIGAISLTASVAATLPMAASKVDLAQRAGQLVPAAVKQVADVIWPNGGAVGEVVDAAPSSGDAPN